MEAKYLIRTRLDCPPGDSQQQLREKDALLKKLASRLQHSEQTVNALLNERRIFVNLIGKLMQAFDRRHSASLSDDIDDDDHIVNGGVLHARSDPSDLDSSDLEDEGDEQLLDEEQAIENGDEMVPVFNRRSDMDLDSGGVLLLSEPYVNLIRQKCHAIKRRV